MRFATLALSLLPSAAFAQRIPDSVAWAVLLVLVAPLLAVPVKRLVGKLFEIEIPTRRLWGLCALDWFLWIPVPYMLFVTLGTTGTAIGVGVIFLFSAWLHRVKNAVGARNAIGPILALLTPVIGLALSLILLAR